MASAAWIILWAPLKYAMEPEREGSTYLVHCKDRLKPRVWPTEAEATAVMAADVTLRKDEASVVPLSVYAAILDARDRSRFKNLAPTDA